ncbi:MAG TPA: hypothetical protein VK009_18905 [Chloroflexota bacterium]|nr:hypothetical protein [Chloroflexota bacterium]
MSAPDIYRGSHRPFWAVWLALLGVLVALVAGAFLLDKQFRSRIGVQPVAVNVASSSAAVPASRVPVADAASVAPVASVNASIVASAASSNSPAAQAVLDAYQHYWQVYSNALLNLDTSHVGDVAAGEELTRIQQEVANFKQRNDAVRVVVEHHYLVFDVNADNAKVYDEVHDRSYAVDPVTKQPPQGPDQAHIEKDTFFFTKTDGGWKVSASTRQRGGG